MLLCDSTNDGCVIPTEATSHAMCHAELYMGIPCPASVSMLHDSTDIDSKIIRMVSPMQQLIWSNAAIGIIVFRGSN